MSHEEGIKLLIQLVNTYVEDESKKQDLVSVILSRAPQIVPVRGIYEEIRKNKLTDFSESDKIVIGDLMHYFG